MSDRIARAYDRAPYPDFAFWATHPDHLGMLGRLFGLATADPAACKVLEIGCAVGGNLVPMAASAPRSRFVGVDVSRVQIDRAWRAVRESGLDNVMLLHGDFRDVPAAVGAFDYIIAHGVYAWVAPDTQAALLAFIRERLAPHGVAFVSYNTYPGHHMVDMVRKVIDVHAGAAPDLATKHEQALAIMRFLHRTSTRLEGDWRTPFFAREIQSIIEGGEELLEHDYCAQESHPVYFLDFVARSRAAGLEYLADSSPWGMYLENNSPEVVETLRPLGDLVLQGQYLDFLQHTRYRETLLCRADAPLTREVRSDAVRGLHIGQALAAEPSLEGLGAGEPAAVMVARRAPMHVSSPVLRLALHALWHHGRYAPSFDALAAEVADGLAAHGLALASEDELRERLAAQLLRAFFASAVRLSLRSPPVARTISERPATGAYQRYTARERRPGIATLSHEVFEATPMMLALLPHLDGTYTHEELAALWPEPIDESLAELLRKGYLLAP